MRALEEALEQTEAHLRAHGFDPSIIPGTKGFPRIQAIADAVEALSRGDEARRRFEILAGIVFARFKALVMERTAVVFAERHDNIEAIFRKLSEKRQGADVTDILKELHNIVGEAIRAQKPSDQSPEPRQYDLSKIDLDKLRQEFERKVTRKATTLRAIQEMVEARLHAMLQQNPLRMDYYKKYSEIVADYNREKDRVTLEETFARVIEFIEGLNEEQRRAVREGLSEEELALFDLLERDNLTKAQRERIKDASRTLLAELQRCIASLDNWTQKDQTQSQVKVLILNRVYESLPTPPYTDTDKESVALRAFLHIFRKSQSGQFPITQAA